MEISKPRESIIQKRLISDNVVISLFEIFATVGAAFIDGLIISIFLGSTSIAAEGMISPFFSLLGMVSGTMVNGTKKFCVNLICKNEKDKAQEVYSTSVFFALACAILIAVCCIGFSDQIVRFLGVSDTSSQLFYDAKMYLIGTAAGAPAIILLPVMTPVIQLSGKKNRAKISMAVIFVLDVLLDILAVFLNFGMLGVGLATSLARTIGLLFLIFPTKIPNVVRLRPKSIRCTNIINVGMEGMPNLVRRLCNLMKPITINQLIISFAGKSGMSAMSVRNSLGIFTECFGAALGSTVLLLSVMFVAEQNEHSLKKLTQRSFKYVFTIVLGMSVLLFLFSPMIACIYIRDDDLASEYASQAIRFMAIDLILIAIMEILTNYWQGIGLTRIINKVVVLQRLVYPVLCVLLCYSIFGTSGVWLSFPLSTLLTILTFAVINYFRTNSLRLFPVPESCRIPDTKKLEYTVYSNEDINGKAEKIQKMCTDWGISSRDAMFIALCFEETANLIMNQGLSKRENEKSFDFFIAFYDGKVTLRFRDNCYGFKDAVYLDNFSYDPEHPEHHVGTRIVMSHAKKIDYVSMLGMNNLTVEF